MNNNKLRSAKKKLRTYEEKHPGVKDERYMELKKNVIKIQVMTIKVEEHNKIMKEEQEKKQRLNDMTDDEFLDMVHSQNAPINAANKKREKNKKKKAQKKDIANKEKEEKHKEIYDKVIQPMIARQIIMSIAENN